MYSLTTTTGPATEPLTRSEAKDHLQIPSSESGHDATIDTLIAAARGAVEDRIERQLVTATLKLQLDRFPAGSSPQLMPRGGLQSVGSITYTDTAGDVQTLSSANYIVATGRDPGIITPAYALVWPDTRRIINAVTINFDCGYGAASAAPDSIKRALLLLIGHWFADREAVVVGTITAELPLGVKHLLAPYMLGDWWLDYGQ